MENKDKNPFPELSLFPRLARAGHFISRLIFGPHLFHEHPLDKPIEPVTDWPLESDGTEPW